jgi:cell division septum initiation protein DivIVA
MNTTDQIKLLNDKLQLVAKRYQSLLKDNERLEQQALLLGEQNAQYRQQLESLQQKNAILKAAKSDWSETDKKDFEKRIQQYVREIDKIIEAIKTQNG